MISFTIHAIAALLWLGALLTASAAGSAIEKTSEQGVASVALTIATILALIAFILQVVA